jgi:hypothetical protein
MRIRLLWVSSIHQPRGDGKTRKWKKCPFLSPISWQEKQPKKKLQPALPSPCEDHPPKKGRKEKGERKRKGRENASTFSSPCNMPPRKITPLSHPPARNPTMISKKRVRL